MSNKTIYALSSVYGKSGVAVIRVSGDNALDVISAMTDIDPKDITPRHAYFTKLYKPQTKDVLDQALVLYFKAPHSFTGEDIVEIDCHGSKAVLASVIDALSRLEGFRLAEAGEFSKRAFYNKKMDLTEAEGLADLIDAETAEQQKQAIAQMSGNLKNLYFSWREELLKVYAYLEAYIDFPDEEIPEAAIKQNTAIVHRLKSEIAAHLKNSNYGERLREGFKFVLAGPTNAGKSSLVNAILKRQAVIVSDTEGTTRDAIDVYLDIAGYPVILTDTAGLRDTTDEIESKGIEIAYGKIEEADFVLAVFDASKDRRDIFDSLGKQYRKPFIFVANKADKLNDIERSELQKQGCTVVSAKTNEGLSDLIDKIQNVIKENIGATSGVSITRARYREALNECLENIEAFSFSKNVELVAEDIRLAARALGKITGQIEVEEVLDKIFSSFCIGK